MEQSSSNKEFKKLQLLLPFFIFGALGIGVFIGGGVGMSTNDSKLDKVLALIEKQYVDSLDVANIENEAIEALLKKLDPHSVYIPSQIARDYDVELQGSFDGIGIYFSLIQDTIVVSAVIEKGPADKAGILAGDKIIAADGTSLLAERLNYDTISKYLKGPSGSMVELFVQRAGNKNLDTLNVKRGSVALKSVSNVFKEGNIGYLKIESFGTNTYEEFSKSMKFLAKKGAQKYVIDFRGNSGGYLHIAESILNDLLDEGVPLFYTEGKNAPKMEYVSDKNGLYRNVPIVILINEESASASEVVAGAIQDSDRGWIVGRRSFGKGLVQEDKELKDGSKLRLTIARYYTPSGRCIQKPYEAYEHDDYYARFESGELSNKDSIAQVDTTTYYTAGGRKVFAGGGILPDFYVNVDTSSVSFILSQMYYQSVFKSVALQIFSYDHVKLKADYSSASLFAKDYQLSETKVKALINRFYYKGMGDVGLSAEEMQKAMAYVKMELAAFLFPKNTVQVRREMGYDAILDKAFEVIKEQNTPLIIDSDYMMPASY